MNFAKTALQLFYKTFGGRVLKTAADNKWVTNMIQKLKSQASTQKIADKVREGIKKDRPFEGFTPTVVPKIVPKKPNPLADVLNAGKYTKVPTPPGLKKSNVIPFPKKPPNLKAEGGRIGTGLNYLLGEDDQNSRVPLKKGKTPFKPPSPGENILESTWKNMGPWEKFMWGLSLGGFEKGGRVGLAAGMTPSESWMRDYFYSGKGGHDDSGMTFEFFQKNIGPDLWYKHIGKAQGGRIGFKEGEGIMSRVGNMVDARNVPYYAGKGLQGLVNSAETLSKLPLAAGELGSKLIQQKPNKEMFMEAIENITPGSWSENTGLTSLVEGMGEKRPDDAKTVGGILGLGTEVAVPTGGAFKAGQILLSKASKAMGKVKDGKTLNKLVEDKISDSGQSRRDFNLMAATSGLMVALKSIGLGGILKGATKVKPSDDVVMTLKTVIDDSDVMTENGPVAMGRHGSAIDVSGLTDAVKKSLAVIMKNSKNQLGEKVLKNKVKGKGGKFTDDYEDIPTEEAAYIMEELQKRGHNVKLEHYDDMGGQGVDDLLNKFKNKDKTYGEGNYDKFSKKVAKMTDKEKFGYHSSITDDYGHYYDEFVEELLDMNFKNSTK